MNFQRDVGRRKLILLLSLVVVASPEETHAQGPNREYFLSPTTTLDWAECQVYQAGGSRLNVPFLPVIFREPKRAPVGTHKYTTDVLVDARLAFVGDGLVTDNWDAYANTYAGDGLPVDVSDRVVMLCYDCLNARVDSGATGTGLVERLVVAATRGAAAVVLFSRETEAPFLYLRPSEWTGDELPVITVSRQTAREILSAMGFRGPDVIEQLNGSEPPKLDVQTTAIHLRIDGAFDRIETDQFEVLFKSSLIDREDMTAVVGVQDWSLSLIRTLLGGAADRPLPKRTTVYFAGFDSKVFYTHHWGSGLASEAGTFVVWRGTEVDSGLIAHELAHIFTWHSWGSSSSFMAEGVGRFVEARATDPEMNHRSTLNFLDGGSLPPLGDLIEIDIGSHELTAIAYPAAGSFVEYLLTEFGMDTLRRVWGLEDRTVEERRDDDTWQSIFGRRLADLESDWREWLRTKGGAE